MRSEPCAFFFASVFMRFSSVSKVTETRFPFRCFVSLDCCGFAFGTVAPAVRRGAEGRAERRTPGQPLPLGGKQRFAVGIVASSVCVSGN